MNGIIVKWNNIYKKIYYFTNHNENNRSSFLLLVENEDIKIDSENNLERGVFTLQKMG
jgi:hypothetical protein